MKNLIFYCLFILVTFRISCGFPPDPHPSADPIKAIQGLVSRLLGEDQVDKFQYEVIPTSGNDVFEIAPASDHQRPVLRGNTGVALASALNAYLKYYCNCSVTWGRDGTGSQLSLPQPLVVPSKVTHYVSPVKYRYYQNVCTVSYSMAWWDFKRWEIEIDWMALNGINLPLSFTGQEAVWKKLYTKLGLTEEEIEAYFSGPAFLAWQRMGNIKGWMGPLDDGWIEKQKQLQLQILERARLFGMYNVLPGFSGHIPHGLLWIYPNASVVRSADWNDFGDVYSEDYLLEPTDPLFKKIGEQYYNLLIDEFGTDHFFNADTYNEMDPSSKDHHFLAETNKAIYEAMANVDKEAVFVMQGWLFHSGFWTNDRIQAFLSAVPNDKMIILELNSEAVQFWIDTESYFGKPFIWCLLHNYGGIRGIYGNLTTIATGPIFAENAKGSTMIGTGITPEAIEHNPVVYDLMGEMGWVKEEVDVGDWLKYYAARRYGGYSEMTERAWDILHYSAYNRGFIWNIKSIAIMAPTMKMSYNTSFNATGILDAWVLLYQAILADQVDESVAPLHYDVVDIGRQCLTNLFYDLYRLYMTAFDEYNTTAVNNTLTLNSISSEMNKVLQDLDTYLGTNTNFLLGHWIEDARNTAPANADVDVVNNLERNARNQITMWGPDANINDYASKEWSGLFQDYYLPRWKLFFKHIENAVTQLLPFNNTAYTIDLLELESEFTWTIKSYPTKPAGDYVSLTKSIMESYSINDLTSTYMQVNDTDVNGHNLLSDGYGESTWIKSIPMIARLCYINPSCVGFTDGGYLKTSVSDKKSSPGVTLYIKKT